MRALRAWFVQLGATLRPGFHDRELAEELNGHIELAIQDNLRTGVSPEEARRRAIADLGGITSTSEDCRERRSFARLEAIARDLQYAARTLRHSPVFTLIAVITLSLAIAATSVMFSVVNSVLLRPLPYRSPDQLALVWIGKMGEGRPAYATAEDWRRQNRSFADMAVMDPVSATLASGEGAEKVSVARVSPNFFPLLGIQPWRGRTFSDTEAEQRLQVALISNRFWRTHFAPVDDAIGASIQLDGIPSKIIGVLPEGIEMPSLDADVWEPHTMFPDWEVRRAARGLGSWLVLGRLRPDVTVERADAEMNSLARALDEQLPAAERNRRITVAPLSLYLVGKRSRLALWMLMGAVLCLLVIAAANVAGLSLARRVERSSEITVRAVLGASRSRIVRQVLAEHLTLTLLAGLLGTAIAAAGIGVIRAFGPADVARLHDVRLDLRVLGWTLVVSVFTGMMIGLTSALLVLRSTLSQPGSSGQRVSAGAAVRSIRRGLVVSELALAIVLLATGALLVRSWISVEHVDPGFVSDRILSVQLSTTASVTPAQRPDFYDRLLTRIRALPGVQGAAIVGDLFIGAGVDRVVTTEGRDGAVQRVQLRMDESSPGFFTTLGTPLLRGRFFSAADGPNALRVAIVNDSMARRLWPGADPVGARFKLGPRDSANPWLTVVGVVADMRRQGPEAEPIPQVFQPLSQDPSGLETLLVKTSAADPLKAVASLRAAVADIDKQVPIYNVTTVDNRLDWYLGQRRFQMSLLSGFAVMALLLAALGIYGLVHYSVASRRREIAIRAAIGARADEIVRMIMLEGLRLAAAGLIAGLAAAVLVGRLGSSLLYGVAASDALTLGIVSLILAAVAVTACYLPARRAMDVDPVVALRQP